MSIHRQRLVAARLIYAAMANQSVVQLKRVNYLVQAMAGSGWMALASIR